MKLENPWKQNPWFESVAVAQERARKRLPKPVYGALVAGSERGQSIADNQAAFAELGLAPHVVGQQPERDQSTTVFGHPIGSPVLISPTGVQAVHPDGEVAVARAAAARGTIMGLSNFASKSVEEVTATGATTFFQMYWTGDRDTMIQRMQRAHAAGAKGLIATLDWSFSMGRDWGSPGDPGEGRPQDDAADGAAGRDQAALAVAVRPAHGDREIPDLTAPNLAPPGGEAPTFFGAYYEWMTTPPPSWDDVAWMREHLDRRSAAPRSCSRACAASTTRCARSTPASPGSRCPTTAATTSTARRPRSGWCSRSPTGWATRSTCVMDGGVRRGSDVVKALALGAKAVLIGRAYLWGLAANGQAGVENVLDVLSGGIDSALRGLALSSIAELTPEHLLIPDGFHRALGVPTPTSVPS